MVRMQKQVAMEGMIGLEIHAYLVTKEKLFCDCIASREKGLKANIHVCPICTGQPGAKPMAPNGEAVQKAVLLASLLGCTVRERSNWQRKHYSWPDLPKGYQTTFSGSASEPFAVGGTYLGIGIQQVHLEEDPASWEPETGKVDYNRSGLPLVEMVTDPDFSTAEEVHDWLTTLIHHLSYAKIIVENAGIKVDVNVSVKGGTRVEVKNISSLESIGKAIVYELARQQREGQRVQETRRWDDVKGITVVMRSKEGAADYRFLVDPDLPSLVLTRHFIDEIAGQVPESPAVKLERLVTKWDVDETAASVLAQHSELVTFFEAVVRDVGSELAVPWVTIELLRLLNYHNVRLDAVQIDTEHFSALLQLVKRGTLTPLQAKDILKGWYPKSRMPVVSAGKISDEKELGKFIVQAIHDNQQAVADYKAGEQKALDFLMGAVMKASSKRADYGLARKLLLKALSSK